MIWLFVSVFRSRIRKFVPPGSFGQKYGSGSFHHQAEIVKKNFFFYCYVTY
jgi:hypothetical protein